jgi:DNA-binding transcriptional regulator GbsR (MarR family)/TPR repeat protein
MTTNKQTRPTIDFIYNPDNQTKEQLIDSFVVRLKTFERLFSDIREAKMESPEQHYLIEGKRGMGKTTLLLRLGYAVENEESLNSWLVPIVFNEEEYSIRRLYKLWERIAILLAEKDPRFAGLFDEMDKSYPNYPSEDEYEYAISNLLNTRLEEKGKKLILFIDNFGDIFSKFNKQEIQRLRTVLQTNVNFRIFGASSTVLEAFYDNKHPFFEFFKVTRLRGLDKQEAQELLLQLGKTYKQEQIKDIIENQPGRIESLRRLTGGVIRTIVLLFEIFIDQKDGSAFSDLEAILDRVTPLYKHRMDDLPAQQQEIVSAIALAWDAINVSEISQKTRIPSKTVSAQLHQMEKNEIISKKLTHNKNHLYQISERFFNIWYLMRHGRKGDKTKVLWLVRFLEEWCDENELVARTQRHIELLRKGKYHIHGGYYLTEALAATQSLPAKSQDELLKATRDFLSKNNSDFVAHLSESDVELHEKAITFADKSDYASALGFFLKMKHKDEFKIGYCYDALKDLAQAEAYYLMAVEKGEAGAMNNLAMLYYEQKTKKDSALDLAEQSYKATPDENSSHTYSLILLWNNNPTKSTEIAQAFLYNKEHLNKYPEAYQAYLLLLLAKAQYEFLYTYFTSPLALELDLQDQYKPIWYTLMYYMQAEYPNEYLRMGEELEETVHEIIQKVERLRVEYA